jgi:hypothetical protein
MSTLLVIYVHIFVVMNQTGYKTRGIFFVYMAIYEV